MSEVEQVAESAPPKARRTRATVAMVLVVVASLLVPAACLTVWVRNVVLNTDRYVETVKPLAENEAVRHALAARVTTAVVDALDLQKRAQDALPAKARFLAGPIAAGGEQLVGTVATKLVDTKAFPKVWELLNRDAHNQIVAALTGRSGGAVTNDNGKVVLNLRPLAQQLATQLAKVAPGFPKNVDLSRVNTRFVLVDSSDLASVQSYARLLDRLSWAVPALALLLYGAAIAVSPSRRRAVIWVGLGIAVAMALELIAYGFGRTLYLDNLPATAHADAAAAVFDTMTRFLERAMRMLLVVGLVAALVAWLAGPSRAAEAVRRQWRRLVDRDVVDQSGAVPQWVARNAVGLRIGLLVTLVLILVAWTRPTGLVVLSLAVVALLGLAAIQLIGAGASGSPVGVVDEPTG